MNESTPPPINPYQTPVSTNGLPQVAAAGDFFRDGKFLIFRDLAELPPRCLVSGEEVTADGWRKRKRILWSPPWVFIGLLFGALPTWILILVFQRKAHIVYSLGQKARSRIRNRQLLGTGCLIAFVVIVVAAGTRRDIGSHPEIVVPLSIITLILGMIFLMTSTPFKANGHRKGWFRMKGVSPDLLDGLPQADWKSL